MGGIIEFRRLTKSYGQTVVFRNLDLDIRSRQAAGRARGGYSEAGPAPSSSELTRRTNAAG